MISSLITTFVMAIITVMTFLVSLLPSFSWPDLASYLTNSGAINYIGHLNWVFPVGMALTVTSLWATAIILYRVYLSFSSWFQSWSTKLF